MTDHKAAGNAKLPLSGIRVIDLSRILSGPYCTMLLGDWGADIIKIERPGTGDDTRLWGPPFQAGESTYFMSINRNKRSVIIDLQRPEGQALVREMVKQSDVVIENFRPGTAERLGVGYEQLAAINPKIVYCSISGFGQTGPYRERPGYDAIAQAMSGMMSITGEPDGLPIKHGMSIADLSAGLMAAFAISTALVHRERNGEGQHLDISLLDTHLSWLTYIAQSFFATGERPGRVSTRHPTIVPYQPFPTQDGYVMIGVANDKLWRGFCEATGFHDLAADPRYATTVGRVEHREELVPELSRRFQEKPTQHWLDVLRDAGIPVGPIYHVDEVFADPHVLAREMVLEMEHPTAGTLKTLGMPAKFSKTPGRIASPPPLLGQHTREVLREFGYSDRQIEDWLAAGVIGESTSSGSAT